MPNLTEELVVDCVREVLAGKRRKSVAVDGQTSLEDLNFDSLDVAELFATLEECAGEELDPDSARDMRTVGDLSQLRPAASV